MPHIRLAILAVAIAAIALPALAQDQPDYLDDRSTAESVIRSFYNAISRQEYARAWSYYQDGQGVPKFNAFVTGYSKTQSVEVTLGETQGEGAAGSTFYTVPVSLDAIDTSGKHSYFAGCYTLRLAQPAIQAEPPFRPLHIVEGKLKKVDGSGEEFLPTDCGS
jgi:hypothetical protein